MSYQHMIQESLGDASSMTFEQKQLSQFLNTRSLQVAYVAIDDKFQIIGTFDATFSRQMQEQQLQQIQQSQKQLMTSNEKNAVDVGLKGCIFAPSFLTLDRPLYLTYDTMRANVLDINIDSLPPNVFAIIPIIIDCTLESPPPEKETMAEGKGGGMKREEKTSYLWEEDTTTRNLAGKKDAKSMQEEAENQMPETLLFDLYCVSPSRNASSGQFNSSAYYPIDILSKCDGFDHLNAMDRQENRHSGPHPFVEELLGFSVQRKKCEAGGREERMKVGANKIEKTQSMQEETETDAQPDQTQPLMLQSTLQSQGAFIPFVLFRLSAASSR